LAERDHSLPRERNPQSVAKEFAPPPQGESVLDASMMAELIVTKKEIAAQLKKSARTSRAWPKIPRRVWSTIAVGGKAWSRAFDCLVPGFGSVLGGGVRCLSLVAG